MAVLLLLTPLTPTAQPLHDTGTVQMEVYGNGALGNDALDFTSGFFFNATPGLFDGQFLVGASLEQVSGVPYAQHPNGNDPEWVNFSGPETLPLPLPIPWEEYDEAYGASYDDSIAPNPTGIVVVERSYSCEHPSYSDAVLFEFGVTNVSGADLSAIYIGIWADFDVGDFSRNLGTYDEDTESIYVWYPTDPNSNYFGVTAINGEVSGWDIGGDGDNPDWDVILYTSMTNGGGIIPAGPDDLKTVIGTGPWDIPSAATVVAIFAFVAGEDEADFLANAQSAREACGGFLDANEPSAGGAGLRLHDAYPNPSRGRTTVAFSVETPKPVYLAVYDALGREIAVLAEGMQAAGEHRVTWDTSASPSGVYVVRLEAEGGRVARRVLLAK